MNKYLINFTKIFLFPFIVFIANEFCWRLFTDWYKSNGIDSYFHFVGGVSIAFTASQLSNYFEKENFIILKRKLIKAFLIISFVAFAALVWEIHEFILDQFYHTSIRQPSNFDTMKDMILGLVGGIFFTLTSLFLRSKAPNSTWERDTLTNMLNSGNPAYDSLKTNSETRMRN